MSHDVGVLSTVAAAVVAATPLVESVPGRVEVPVVRFGCRRFFSLWFVMV